MRLAAQEPALHVGKTENRARSDLLSIHCPSLIAAPNLRPAGPTLPLRRPSRLLSLCSFVLSCSVPHPFCAQTHFSPSLLFPQHNSVTNLKKPHNSPLPSSSSPLLGNLVAYQGSPQTSPTHHVHACPVMLSSQTLCSDGLRMPFPCSGCMPWSSAVC